jgi:hypothetical protein
MVVLRIDIDCYALYALLLLRYVIRYFWRAFSKDFFPLDSLPSELILFGADLNICVRERTKSIPDNVDIEAGQINLKMG